MKRRKKEGQSEYRSRWHREWYYNLSDEEKKELSAKMWENKLKRLYGITATEYYVLLERQNHRCAICGEKEQIKNAQTKKTIKLSVDHCHKTGHVRGLLCNRCNTVIGRAEESDAILTRMIDYLKGM